MVFSHDLKVYQVPKRNARKIPDTLDRAKRKLYCDILDFYLRLIVSGGFSLEKLGKCTIIPGS